MQKDGGQVYSVFCLEVKITAGVRQLWTGYKVGKTKILRRLSLQDEKDGGRDGASPLYGRRLDPFGKR